MICIYYGEEVLPEAVNALAKYFEETYPDCDVEVQLWRSADLLLCHFCKSKESMNLNSPDS